MRLTRSLKLVTFIFALASSFPILVYSDSDPVLNPKPRDRNEQESLLEAQLNGIVPMRASYSYEFAIDTNFLIVKKRRIARCVGTLLFEEITIIDLLVLDFNVVAITYAERLGSDKVSIEYVPNFQDSVRLQNNDYLEFILSRIYSEPNRSEVIGLLYGQNIQDGESYIFSENCRGEIRLLPLPSGSASFYVQAERGSYFVQLLEDYQRIIATSIR